MFKTTCPRYLLNKKKCNLPIQHLPLLLAQKPVIVPLRLLHSRRARHVPFIVLVLAQSTFANRTILTNGNTKKKNRLSHLSYFFNCIKTKSNL